MPDQLSPELLNPNHILHSWTHEGMYYAITRDGRVMRSDNKFTYSATEIASLPNGGNSGYYVSTKNARLEILNEFTGEAPIYLATVIVKGSIIFVEHVHLEYSLASFISKDFGQSWAQLGSLQTETPEHLSRYDETQAIWRGGFSSFLVTDEMGCDTYVFKPMFKQRDDDTYHVSGWLVVRDDDTIIHNSADPTKDVINFERRFESSGELLDRYDNKINSMDGHPEKYRKPYSLMWPQYQTASEAPPTQIDYSGHLVNPCSTVTYRGENRHYNVIQVPQEIRIKMGLLAENENRYMPDMLTMRVPIFFVIESSTLRNASVESKANVRVLDLTGFDTYLAPLHKAQFTTRAGVYSFIQNMIGKGVNLFETYGAPGTVYSYNAPSGETFPERVLITEFEDHLSGDLFKITDPEVGKDVLAFLYRNRVKVCINDPSREYNWVDKTSNSTFVRSTQRIQTNQSAAVVSEDTNNNRSLIVDVWSGYDKVLRYDYEDNRVLGYPIYAVNQTYDPGQNLIGYNFPALIRTGQNNYTVGYAQNGGVEYREMNVTRQFKIGEVPSNTYIELFYGGFVGDTRGYVGSLSKFVNGIAVTPEPEFPTQPVQNPPTPPGPPLAAPSIIALLDDITRSTSAVIASNRQAVQFGLLSGSAVANNAVGSSKWYVELNGITTPHIFFGIAKAGFDVTKEPGYDASVVAVGIDGSVLRGGSLVYKTSSPLIDFGAGGSPTIGLVIDMDNRILQFTNGEGAYYSQAIGGLPTGSLMLYVGSTANTTNSTVSSVAINFGQLPFKYVVPNEVHRGYGIA